MKCRSRRGPAVGLAILLVTVAWHPVASAQAPAQAKPADHTQDHRGGVAGVVRNAAGGGATAGLTVVATNADNGARFTATTDGSLRTM